MEDINDYFKVINDYPPIFTNIDWNNTTNNEQNNEINFLPMEFDNKNNSYQHQPFQRRRSSSVDLPINPLYSNTNKLIINEPPIQEEEYPPMTRMNRIGSSATLEFPGNFIHIESPLSTASSEHNNNSMSPPTQQQQNNTYFPELHRTSYNTLLGKQLKQHQKRRRSSSLPPAFHRQQKQHIPTPLIFTQIQVTDPTPIHHTQKAQKVDTRPVAIERVHKPQPKPVTCDPIETQKKLDEQLIQLNFEDVTVAELKEMLRDRGLPATGKKAILTDRLKDARDKLNNTWFKDTSPNIQGLANMTINSPIPLFMPMEELQQKSSSDTILFQDLDIHPNESMKQESLSPTIHPTSSNSVSPNISYENYSMHPNHTQPLENYHYTNDEIDINDLFNFDDTQYDNNTNWDQDKLDFFLKELI